MGWKKQIITGGAPSCDTRVKVAVLGRPSWFPEQRLKPLGDMAVSQHWNMSYADSQAGAPKDPRNHP